MITRMEITYKSVQPCDVRPSIFSTGGYHFTKDGVSVSFDFEDMEASVRFEDNGYMYIDCLQRNVDETMFGDVCAEEADKLMRTVKKEDFTEIYSESYLNDVDGNSIEIKPIDITFYDFSIQGTGEPIPVLGESFSGLI